MRTSRNKISGSRHSALDSRGGEEGYTLVALLALMTIMALIMTAAAPSIRQQAQREREQEAIFRGEEVAQAIGFYFKCTRTLPISMDQLLEGAPCQGRTKKLQVLRPEAAVDPLSSDGQWRLVQPRGREMIEFKRAVMEYANARGDLRSTDQQLAQQFDVQVVNILSLATTGSAPSALADTVVDGANPTGPFIGVASRSHRNSIINYYGIDRHDRWVFTPLYR